MTALMYPFIHCFLHITLGSSWPCTQLNYCYVVRRSTMCHSLLHYRVTVFNGYLFPFQLLTLSAATMSESIPLSRVRPASWLCTTPLITSSATSRSPRRYLDTTAAYEQNTRWRRGEEREGRGGRKGRGGEEGRRKGGSWRRRMREEEEEEDRGRRSIDSLNTSSDCLFVLQSP